MTLTFPLPATAFAEWVPHRAPMVWIDEVLWVDAAEGECRVRFDKRAHYFCADRGLRPSSLIEWIAQGYAFVRAAQAMAGVTEARPKPKVAFLAAVRDLVLDPTFDPRALRDGAELRVRIRCGREIGPIAIVDGTVSEERGALLGSANLKVFAEAADPL